jgi:hypothetical protein
LGQLLGGIVRGATSEAKIGNPDLFSNLTAGAVMAFAVIAALNELNVAPVVVNTLFIGLVSAVALALGLAFGLGGRETAGKLTEKWAAQLETSAQKVQAMPPKPKAVPVMPNTGTPSKTIRTSS